MAAIIRIASGAVLLAAALTFAAPVNVAHAGFNWKDIEDCFGGKDKGHDRPAPGPLAGAGLPVFAIGYGAYWLVRRVRRKGPQS